MCNWRCRHPLPPFRIGGDGRAAPDAEPKDNGSWRGTAAMANQSAMRMHAPSESCTMAAQSPTPCLSVETGDYMLPPGMLAAAVTYLDFHAPFASPSAAAQVPLTRLTGRDVTRYRALFRAVGAPFLWWSRLAWSDERLAAQLGNPEVEAFALTGTDGDIGLLELDFRSMPQAELAYFGLAPGAVGQGLGRALMDEAKRRAFSRPISRLFVHTCTLDHPKALGFYQAMGFVAYARGVEIMPDPRLSGLLPRDCAPQVPLIEGTR